MRKPKAIIGLLASIIVCMGLAAPAAQAADTQTSNLPDHIVNGDFEYPTAGSLDAAGNRFVYLSLTDGTYCRNDEFVNGYYVRHRLPTGFDKTRFAWHSTQTGTGLNHPDAEKQDDVQIWFTGIGGNQYAELTAAQRKTAIYQDVATQPGVMYHWRLKHANNTAGYADKMSVLIGQPGHETAQRARRTTVNGHGDQLGDVGTIISTKVSNTDANHQGQWETYEGTYIATGTVTRFTFKNIDGINEYSGNMVDDISFEKAYPLAYDGNGAQQGVTLEQRQ